MVQKPADSDVEAIGQTGQKDAPTRTGLLMLGALGVVYGDIGTSPIYAFREALVAASGSEVAEREDILGVLSLILWALTIIVTIKYITFVLKADNRGEGGTLSLMALVQNSFAKRSSAILIIGILGASLFYGDAVITPAISVLSAGRGHEGGDADFRAVCRAADACDPGYTFRRAALRH